MARIIALARKARDGFALHARIITALFFRETTTRYGRDNLGFLWIVGEPFLFVAGVMTMWSFIRAPYDHGIRLLPFLVTGYLPLLLLRHTISHGIGCVRVNINLLYHRSITVLHIYFSRCLLEMVGVTMSFIVIVLVLIPFGLIEPPMNYAYVYLGWILLAWITFGMTVLMGAICEIFEFFERFANLISYVLIPISGAFYMVAWIPERYRSLVLKLPFVNCIEMIRHGWFGEFYPTYFSIGYAAYWGLGLTFVGLLVLSFVRTRLDVE